MTSATFPLNAFPITFDLTIPSNFPEADFTPIRSEIGSPASSTAWYREYKVLAVDGDIIEAIEIPSSSFAYGIQFHPEYYSDYKDKKEWKVSLELLSRVIDKIDKWQDLEVIGLIMIESHKFF